MEKPTQADLHRLFPISFISPESWPEASTSDQSQPRFTRKFRFGTIDVENGEHCEFMGLKQLLLGTGWKTLKDATLEKYEIYRTQKMTEQEQRRHKQSDSGA